MAQNNAHYYDAVIVNGLWQYIGLAVWRPLAGSNTPYSVFTHGILNTCYKAKTILQKLIPLISISSISMHNALLNKIKFFLFLVNHPLCRDRKCAALLRYFRWQFGSRLVTGDVLTPFVDKTFLRIRPGLTGATMNIYAGLHEFEDMAFMLHSLRPTDLFIDIGANIGSYTILSGAVGSTSISIEPIKNTFKQLIDNINLNYLNSSAKALNIGIGKERCTLEFTKGLDCVNHVVTDNEKNADTVIVPIENLDYLLADEEPTLIKIDVEGFETNVISGADTILKRPTLMAVIMELNGSGDRYGFDENLLHERMLSYGFETFTYLPFIRELVSLNNKKSKSGNTLYVRNIDVVATRLRESKKYWIANVDKMI